MLGDIAPLRSLIDNVEPEGYFNKSVPYHMTCLFRDFFCIAKFAKLTKISCNKVVFLNTRPFNIAFSANKSRGSPPGGSPERP